MAIGYCTLNVYDSSDIVSRRFRIFTTCSPRLCNLLRLMLDLDF